MCVYCALNYILDQNKIGRHYNVYSEEYSMKTFSIFYRESDPDWEPETVLAEVHVEIEE